MHNLTDVNFWFFPPTDALTHADKVLGYICSGTLLLGIIFYITVRFLKNPVYKKLLNKLWYLGITIGLFAIFWFGLRYENTPIFAKRFWLGIIAVGAIVWLLFILKYFIFNFFQELKEYEREQLKNKYIPKR